MKTTVVNVRNKKCDVHIGRPSKWGNPFKIGRDGDRTEVIKKHRQWILTCPALLKSIQEELKGKRLGCYCKPQSCHGDILAELANDELDT